MQELSPWCVEQFSFLWRYYVARSKMTSFLLFANLYNFLLKTQSLVFKLNYHIAVSFPPFALKCTSELVFIKAILIYSYLLLSGSFIC